MVFHRPGHYCINSELITSRISCIQSYLQEFGLFSFAPESVEHVHTFETSGDIFLPFSGDGADLPGMLGCVIPAFYYVLATTHGKHD